MKTHRRAAGRSAKRVALRAIFVGLQNEMVTTLTANRERIPHPGTQGATTELHWLEMLNSYLPTRYRADNAFVIDHQGQLSDQIDVVIYDRQYSPLLFSEQATKYVPAESVYAVFEVKPSLDGPNLEYAGAKAGSVRRLLRTSAAIPHAGGRYRPKKPPRILAGILTLENGWQPPIANRLRATLAKLPVDERLDLGCALKDGGFEATYGRRTPPTLATSDQDTALVFFFLRLLGRLQAAGTAPALDFEKYTRGL